VSSEPDPIERFGEAFARAHEGEPELAEAVVLATADAQGRPSARVVLCKGADERGFVFFTNYRSRKAVELTQNPFAALCFHWKSLGEQIRVEGRVGQTSAEESDTYFASRPLESRYAAIASQQSSVLDSRETLEQRYQDLRAQAQGDDPARPSHWGGYRLVPDRIEFWYHRDHRLHHRVLYRRDGTEWRVTLLEP
jgi:pyridoxamine 5'-phosphate oxidase